MKLKKRKIVYWCIVREESYGAYVMGEGATLDQAYEGCKNSVENLGGDMLNVDRCFFYEVTSLRPLAVTTETCVKIALQE